MALHQNYGVVDDVMRKHSPKGGGATYKSRVAVVEKVAGYRSEDLMSSSRSGPPAGLEALTKACSSIYPDQTNPLQVTALVKYW